MGGKRKPTAKTKLPDCRWGSTWETPNTGARATTTRRRTSKTYGYETFIDVLSKLSNSPTQDNDYHEWRHSRVGNLNHKRQCPDNPSQCRWREQREWPGWEKVVADIDKRRRAMAGSSSQEVDQYDPLDWDTILKAVGAHIASSIAAEAERLARGNYNGDEKVFVYRLRAMQIWDLREEKRVNGELPKPKRRSGGAGKTPKPPPPHKEFRDAKEDAFHTVWYRLCQTMPNDHATRLKEYETWLSDNTDRIRDFWKCNEIPDLPELDGKEWPSLRPKLGKTCIPPLFPSLMRLALID